MLDDDASEVGIHATFVSLKRYHYLGEVSFGYEMFPGSALRSCMGCLSEALER